MTIDATFWVTISFFIFLGILIYFKIPQKVKETLEQNILNIKNQISEAEKLKEDAKNILTENEKKISNSKNEVKDMINASVKIALESVEKLIKNSLDKSKLDKIYSSSIEETKLALKKKSS